MFFQLMNCGYPKALLRRHLRLKYRRLRMLSCEASGKLSRRRSPNAEAVYPEHQGRQLNFEFHLLHLRPASKPSRSTNASSNSGEKRAPEDPRRRFAEFTTFATFADFVWISQLSIPLYRNFFNNLRMAKGLLNTRHAAALSAPERHK
jgi:hypothetical protein